MKIKLLGKNLDDIRPLLRELGFEEAERGFELIVTYGGDGALLFDFVKDQCSPPDRKTQEARVRHAANHLMQMGMETDNAFAIADGAKIAMRLDRLDEPESEQADMSKMMFLPPVVVTSAKEVDETKEELDDAEMKRIMAKYNGYVDEKERDIEKMVETMEAKGQATTGEEMTADE